MKKTHYFLLLGLFMVVALSLASCKGSQYAQQSAGQYKETKEAEPQRIPLTTGLIQQHSLTGEHLQKIQFFVEGTIVLSANIEARSLAVEGGDLVVKQTTRPIDVQIKNQSPGVFQGINKNAIAVRFEQDGHNRFLWFMPAGPEGRYYLAGVQNGTGLVVKYDDREYFADATSRSAFLSINVRQISELDPQKRIAPGVKLGESSGTGTGNDFSGGPLFVPASNQGQLSVPSTQGQQEQPKQQPKSGSIKGQTF